MRLPEQRLYDWLARRIGHVAQLTRVENKVGRDTPDLFVAHPQWCGWVELKAIADWPVQAKTRIRVGHWTSGQRWWATRHLERGGRCALVVEFYSTGEIFVFRAGAVALQLDAWNRAQWEQHALWWGNRNATSQQVLDALAQV